VLSNDNTKATSSPTDREADLSKRCSGLIELKLAAIFRVEPKCTVPLYAYNQLLDGIVIELSPPIIQDWWNPSNHRFKDLSSGLQIGRKFRLHMPLDGRAINPYLINLRMKKTVAM
jgi:hypothetical protein